MDTEVHKPNKQHAHWVMIIVAVNIFAIITTSAWAFHDWRQRQADALIKTENLSFALSNTVGAILGKVDISLLHVASDVVRTGANVGSRNTSYDELLRHVHRDLPNTIGIRILSPNGDVVSAASNVVTTNTSLSNRDFFATIRDDNLDSLVFGKPAIGRTSNVYMMPMGRRISGVDGSFIGEVVDSISIDFLQSLFNPIDVGNLGFISIRYSDNSLITGKYPEEMRLAREASGADKLSVATIERRNAGVDHATYYSSITGPDHLARVISFHKVFQYPIYVYVATAESDYLHKWYITCASSFIFVSAFCLLTIFLGRLEYKRQRQANEFLISMTHANEVAAAARDRAEAILSSAGQGIYGIDRNGLISFANEAASQMLGWSNREIIGKDQHQLIHHTRVDGTPYPVTECPILKTLYICERVRIRGEVFWRKDGSSFPVDYSGAPIMSGDAAIGVVVVFADITDVIEHEKLLVQAREDAENAAGAKSSFLAMMSHEIRTPLTGVIGTAEFLDKSSLDNTQRTYLSILLSSARGLLTILNDILDFSKIDANRLTIEVTTFDVIGVAYDISRLFMLKAKENNNTLNIDTGGVTTLLVKGDQLRIKQVLGNLVGNAAKFTRDGSISILVRHSDYGERILLKFEVIDTGIGMTHETTMNLFQPFSQADTSISRKFGGTGLGLAISKRLVELMGGEIGVSSALTKGSLFWFTCMVDKVAASDLVHSHKSGVIVPPLSLLLAEDNQINRMIIKAGLEQRHHRVTVVENGLQAYEAVAGRHFDVVLMDMQMPVMDGIEATRRIRSLPKPFSDVPVIALTADVMTEHRSVYMEAGLTDYLTKPIEWDNLDAALLKLHSGSTITLCLDNHIPTYDEIISKSDALPLIDVAKFSQIRDTMSQQEISSLVSDIIITSNDEFVHLSEAIKRHDLATIRRIAHSMKGMFGNFGADRLAFLSKIVQQAPSVSDVNVVMPSITIALDGTMAQLGNLIR